ncbi:helix-turn-helix domain-containing protein [Thiotrichales bacterium 19S9-12]|nr:helix-turn-helix domain-containing protein [Thiotrichales bacterium 19S9-11]MCF6811219.1 helix-turn-helix domain-containing protein [Thiotrichales bacterium 19S9-12]
MTTNAHQYLESLLDERISLGMAIRTIRTNEEISQGAFAKKLGVTQSYLSDLEHNRKQISPKKAAEFAKILGQSQKQFVRLAIQDTLERSGLHYEVDIRDVA